MNKTVKIYILHYRAFCDLKCIGNISLLYLIGSANGDVRLNKQGIVRRVLLGGGCSGIADSYNGLAGQPLSPLSLLFPHPRYKTTIDHLQSLHVLCNIADYDATALKDYTLPSISSFSYLMRSQGRLITYFTFPSFCAFPHILSLKLSSERRVLKAQAS